MGSASTSETTQARPFGRYRIVRRLAIGGMAEVFLACDAEDATRVVVLKVPIAGTEGHNATRLALEHEARVTLALDHPNLVRTLGTESHQSEVALVLEYVDGVTLDAAIHAATTPLSARVALRVVVTLLRALNSAHQARDQAGSALGLVHRDINPHNVLVSRDGVVKLGDFGIARSRLGDARTRTGAIKGTLRYLTPEQATGSTVDARTDLYAIALVAFELLTGEPYARGETEIELLRNAESPSARPLPADVDVSPDVRGVLTSALARFPEERPTSALAMATALEPFAATVDEAREALARRIADRLPPLRAAAAPLTAETGIADEGTHKSGSKRRLAGALLALSLSGTLIYAASRAHAPAPDSGRTRAVDPTDEAAGDVRTREAALAQRAESRARATTRAAERPNQPLVPPRGITAPPSVPLTRRVVGVVPAVAPRAVETVATTATTATTSAPQNVVEPTPSAASASVVPDGATRESVQRQLARVNDEIRAARNRGDDVSVALSLSRTALEAYGDGRYADSKSILDRIARSLGRESVSE